MPAAAGLKLCSNVSAWLGVFASIAMSSAKSASVIVFSGYLLLLFFVSSVGVSIYMGSMLLLITLLIITMYFFVSDLKIIYYNNYSFSITMSRTREGKYFASLIIWRQNHLKLSQNRCNPFIWWWFITDTRNPQRGPGSWK